MSKTCCICGQVITGYGNNPDPFRGTLCCDWCNNVLVTPARIIIGARREQLGTKFPGCCYGQITPASYMRGGPFDPNMQKSSSEIRAYREAQRKGGAK